MDKAEVQKNLEEIKEVKGTEIFYDLHVHPFEVMFSPASYEPSPISGGLYGAGNMEYIPPSLTDLKFEPFEQGRLSAMNAGMKEKLNLFNARRAYSHTGPRVFSDLMELSCVDRALLLPVTGDQGSSDDQFQVATELFGDDDRFFFGYSPPNGTDEQDISLAVQRAVEACHVKALKIHPNVTGIDLGCRSGVARMEWLLEVSRMTRLKVIVHGGLSPDCQKGRAASFASVRNLAKVDWSITPETVVIAHGGCFGHTPGEASQEVLPTMSDLLGKYPNLAVDTSGLGLEVLCELLNRIDAERIYFGSDALYEKQWGAMLKLWLALKRTDHPPAESLVRIAGHNPAAFLGEDRRAELACHRA